MARGLFRRVVGRGRGSRSGRRGSSSAGRGGSGAAIRDASGKRYRVVEVDETAEAEFADPPRTWSRVGALAAGWAIVLVLGGWIAPGFAASSSGLEDDSDEIVDAKGAAWVYLSEASNENLDLANDALCDDAEPQVTPAAIDSIRQSYIDLYGGITNVGVSTGETIATSNGVNVPSLVKYDVDGPDDPGEEFLITVQERSGTYCVFDVVWLQDEDPSPEETSGEVVDPKSVATNFLRMIVVNAERNLAAAAALECSPAPEFDAHDLDAAIAAWEELNTTAEGTANGFINSLVPAEGSVTAFTAEIELRGDLANETFTFDIGVQGDCVSSITTETGFPDGSGG